MSVDHKLNEFLKAFKELKEENNRLKEENDRLKEEKKKLIKNVLFQI